MSAQNYRRQLKSKRKQRADAELANGLDVDGAVADYDAHVTGRAVLGSGG